MNFENLIKEKNLSDSPIGLGGCRTTNSAFDVCDYDITVFDDKSQENEIFDKYVEVVFKSMWVDNKKMDDLEVIQSVLLENGLPVKEIFEGTQDQKIKDKLIKNTSEAVEKGVFGAPSLLVNNELFFGKETLQDVEELLLKEIG